MAETGGSETLERIDRNLAEMHRKINQIAINQAEASAKFQAHNSQGNGRSIHHTPPCDALEEHCEGHHRAWRLLIWVLGVGIAMGSLVTTIIMGVAK